MSGHVTPPDELRCRAVNTRGERCGSGLKYGADLPLCTSHCLHGAVIPDEWTPSGLPVFTTAAPVWLRVYECDELVHLYGRA